MWIDTHVHSTLSTDGGATAREQCSAALAAGLDGLCFTEHIDYDQPIVGASPQGGASPKEGASPQGGASPKPRPEGWFVVDVPRYRAGIAALRAQFPMLTIGFGLELGDRAVTRARNAELLAAIEAAEGVPLDFVLLSRHVVRGVDPYDGRYFDDRSRAEAFTAYAQACLESVQANEDFDAFSHIGYAAKYAPYADPALVHTDAPEILDALLRELAQRGKALEINTSSLAYTGAFTPTRALVARFAAFGGEWVSLGSDAHFARSVGSALREAAEYARRCGIRYRVHFQQRKPIASLL